MRKVLLDEVQIKAVYRLIHEACELGADAHAWRAHFQASLLPMVNGATAVQYVMRLRTDPASIGPAVELAVDTNTSEAWKGYVARGDLTDNPQTPHIMARFGTDFTCTRQDLVDDAAWYANDFYSRVCVPSGWDQCMHSQVCIDPPGMVDGLGITRPPGAEPFGRRDVAIVRLAHQELAHLWRKPDALGVNTLPTRLRQTLHCIRSGLSRKEIAQQLRVSPHTAHLHEKTLFARFGVAGRMELMALIASSNRPALLPLKQDNDFFDGPAQTSSLNADG